MAELFGAISVRFLRGRVMFPGMARHEITPQECEARAAANFLDEPKQPAFDRLAALGARDVRYPRGRSTGTS